MIDDDLQRKRELVVALKRAQRLALRSCFDPQDPESRPTKKQEEILRDQATVLHQYVMGGNQSGKTMTGGRAASWIYLRCHPYLNVDELWPNDAMLIVVVGRLHNQVEEIWERKIKPFLDESEYRENRQGGTLQYVMNPKNGSKIIFATHANPVEAREKVQSYSAHFVWMDELCDYLGMLEELQRRTNAKRGRLLLTFTPKIRAEEVKKYIEKPTPFSKHYRISMLDNPVYDDRREEILAQIEGYSEQQRNTILYGDWYVGDKAVFCFDPSKHCAEPPGYSALWPHIVSVDPAASGLMGYTLWAAPDPYAYTWYCVRSEYLKGAAPSDLVQMVEDRVQGHQIVFRIMDSHEAWFQKEATKRGIHYRGVERKRDRKKELIAQLNQALVSGRIKLTSQANDLANELSIAQWSETAEDKIVNASSYHCADAAQYFVDAIPRFKEHISQTYTYDQALRMANQIRVKNERASASKPREKWRIIAKRGRTWKHTS